MWRKRPREVRTDLAISWDFMVGLIKNGASPDLIAGCIKHNDEVYPQWRSTIPDS